jgi:uncharacterized membrane protein YgcG
MRAVLQLILCCLAFALGQAQAGERILSFHSDIEVLESGAMIVEEHIRVHAEGDSIRRGIYRDFPTRYRDRAGNRYVVGFELLGVQRDGRPEAHHTENIDNGIRIYAGKRDHMLQPGEYAYRIRYRTDRQLGFFAQRDELYWNVTGNAWRFPIERASAAVTLPLGIGRNAIRVEGYTGPQGARGKDFSTAIDPGGRVRIETTRALGPGEGLTLAVDWPKGFVHEPSSGERMAWLLADNREALGALGGILAVLLYYLLAWFFVGRDPEAGVSIPLYEPPADYSPGAMRFIRRMGYDNKAFATALVNLAVMGYLEIEENTKGQFTLRKTGNGTAVNPGPGEAAVASALFGDGTHSIVLEQSNHRKLGKALKSHKNALKRHYEKTYFFSNSAYLLPGILLSLGAIALTVLMVPPGEARELSTFLAVWLSGWTLAVVMLLKRAASAWRSALQGGGWTQVLGPTLFAVPFVAAEIAVLFIFGSQASVWVLIAILALVILTYAFYQWLKAPTLAGRRLMDRLEGLRLYLSVAEKDELQFRHPPHKTPELFERLLPYAMALDVEQQWGERFENVLARAQADGSYHRPRWYHGSRWNPARLGSFGSAVGGALAGAVAASSHAPGSSSGMGGGGSSGGGGGGGGGGGW